MVLTQFGGEGFILCSSRGLCTCERSGSRPLIRSRRQNDRTSFLKVLVWDIHTFRPIESTVLWALNIRAKECNKQERLDGERQYITYDNTRTENHDPIRDRNVTSQVPPVAWPPDITTTEQGEATNESGRT